jgi:hypothetical protein
MRRSLRRIRTSSLLLTICCGCIFGLVYFAPNKYQGSDPRYALLVSQSIIEHQTITLDAYKDKCEKDDPLHNFDRDHSIHKTDGHYYYAYPIGTSIFSVPFVWVATLMGKDMSIVEDDAATQSFISAALCVLAFVIIYKICRCYLDIISSLLIAIISMLGSSLASTMGTALWSHDFAVIFVALSILLLALYESGKINAINPFLLGFLLFSAYLCRPTASIFIMVVLVYVYFRHRGVFLRLVITSLALFLFFIAWSWLQYRQLLPFYYTLGSKLTPSSNFGPALSGVLLSPSRGIFVFSPFFVLIVVGLLLFFRRLKTQAMFWLSGVWFCLHVAAISTWDMWWGGHSYGPRLLTDIVPALILITILLWKEISQRSGLRTRRIVSIGYTTLGLAAIFINSYQGLYNINTARWNSYPSIDKYPKLLFNWKYPQFLATSQSLHDRYSEHIQDLLHDLDNYSLGDQVTYANDKAVFINWDEPVADEHWRWSQSTSPQIALKLDDVDPRREYIMEILLGGPWDQEVDVMLNDTKIGHLLLPAYTGSMPEAQTLVFSGRLLENRGLDTLGFHASSPWLAFASLEIHPLLGDKGYINYFDGDFFQTGFSGAEKGWRWTDGAVATIVYPLTTIDVKKDYTMKISSGALGVQEIGIVLNGTHIGILTFEGFEPQTQTLTFSGTLLRDTNTIDFHIPNASIPEGDSRRLGLAFVSLSIAPVD